MMPCGCIITYHQPSTYKECPCECHTEREARLARIAEVYPAAAAEARGLTPGECSDLRVIAERARADDNSADLAPMKRDGRVIPWLEALNLDPALGT